MTNICSFRTTNYTHMEVAKRERVRVKLGDCVSLPTSYWGVAFASQMQSDYGIDKLFGRVSNVNSNNDFSVTWDVDSQVSAHMSLAKCTYEKPDQPKQVLSTGSVITAEDFQAADQCTSSNNINEEHALMVEEFCAILSDDECQPPKEYVLLDGADEVFQGWVVETEPGEVVHHKPLEASQRKFQITHLLEHAKKWSGYDEDIHCVGTFIAWELESTKVKVKGKGKEKKKKKKFEMRIKGKGSGRNLRQRTGEVAYGNETDVTTSEDEDENVKTLMKKWEKKRKGKKKGKVKSKREQKAGGKKTSVDDKKQDEGQKKKGEGKVKSKSKQVGEKRTGVNDKEQDEEEKNIRGQKRQKRTEEGTG